MRLPVIRAAAGDHATIYYFLQAVFQGPSPAEFHASLEDPFYEPFDRLLLRQKRRIVAHVHVTHRTMHFGPVRIPAAGLGWLGVAPEHRGQGLATHLLRAAESRMEIGGALVGMLRTSIPALFPPHGLGVVRSAGLSPRQSARHPCPALGPRPGPPPPPPLAHPPLAPMGTCALLRTYNQNVARRNSAWRCRTRL